MTRRDRAQTILIALLAGTLAGVVSSIGADPRTEPAPVGMREQALTQRVAMLAQQVQDAEAAAWEWRAYQRCIHTRHILVRHGVAAVTWKLEKGCAHP